MISTNKPIPTIPIVASFENGTCPINNTAIDSMKSNNAVDKLSLKIRPQMITMGAIRGKIPSFQSFNLSFLRTSNLDRYRNKASFAKSED